MELLSEALRDDAVSLIQDLNGNHVIQKCLMRFGSKHNQFIFDIVASHCVKVAADKHGCCVFQRCIDYSTDYQKLQIIREVISKVEKLVQVFMQYFKF